MKEFEFSIPTQRIAVTDIGANSVRMLIYDVNIQTGEFSVCDSCRRMLGLAAYVKDGRLSSDGAGKLFAVLREFIARAGASLADSVCVFATASLRGLSNSAQVCENIKKRLGIDITVISGEEEALYDFSAIASRFDTSENGVLIDMGGGSTEIVCFEKKTPVRYVSLPIGCLALSKRFVSSPPHASVVECESIGNYVNNLLKSHPEFSCCAKTAYLIGGTARAARKIVSDGKQCAESTPFSSDDLFSACGKMQNDKKLCCELIKKHAPDRSLTVMPGIVALYEILRYVGAGTLITSDAGVREGFLLEKIKELKSKNGFGI